ncbi:MAG: hypothetical protein HQM12_03795 [SAR324 cluster bacterium]|nr:hypothetical protein [SAR324 cluster bacterium]
MAQNPGALKQKNSKTPGSRSYLNSIFDPTDPGCIPDLRSMYYQEFFLRVQEVEGHRSGLMNSASNLFQKILVTREKLPTDDARARKSAYEILPYNPNQKNQKFVKELEQNPLQHSARLALVSSIIKAGAKLELDQSRKVLMHSMIPLGCGMCDPMMTKLIIAAYRTYQKNLVKYFQQKQEKAGLGHMEKNRDEVKDSRYKDVYQIFEDNLRLLNQIIRYQQSLPHMFELIQPLNIQTLSEMFEHKKEMMSDASIDKIERSLMAMVLTLLEVSILHKEMLKISKQMEFFRPQSPVPFFLQARIWMEQLRLEVFEAEQGTDRKKQIDHHLKETLALYGQSLKCLGKQTISPQIRRQILTGHASACLFAYTLRTVLQIPREVTKKLLLTGQKSLSASKLPVSQDQSGLYNRYLEACSREGLSLDLNEMSD